jgi:hypothetical protein
VSLFDPFQELLIILLFDPVALLSALAEPAICFTSLIKLVSYSDMGLKTISNPPGPRRS